MERSPVCLDNDHPLQLRRWESYRPATYEKAASVFKALGDEARLRLLTLLIDNEMCVSQIAALNGEGLSTVSQRLKALRQEELVVSRREGKHIYYGLYDEHITGLILNALGHAGEEPVAVEKAVARR